MCFLPKSRASMDQAPGPTIAKAAPRTACMMAIHGSPECERNCEKAIHSLTMAAKEPATQNGRPDPKLRVEPTEADDFRNPLWTVAIGTACVLAAMAAVIAFG